MAIKAFTRKTSGPTSSGEFLSKYENLLKRNKGSRFLTGYEATSQNPIYIPGKIQNPTGIGETAQSRSLANSGNEIVPGEIDYTTVNPEQIDISTLTPEELELFYQNPNLSDFQRYQTESVYNNLTEKYQPPITPSEPVVYEGDPNFIGPLQRSYTPSTGTTTGTSVGTGTGNADTMWNQGWNEGFNNPDRQYMGTDPNVKAGYEAGQQEYLNRSQQTQLQGTIDQFGREIATKEGEIAKIDEGAALRSQSPLSMSELGSSWNKYTDIAKANELGITPEELAEQNSRNVVTENDVPEGWERTDSGIRRIEQNDPNAIRQALGNLVSFIGDKAGIPEMNWSEKIAGGPTKDYNKVYAAENYQAGTGLDRLNEGVGFNPTTMASRPDFSEVGGLKRTIGNVSGMTGQSAITPNNQSTPSGQIPNMARVTEGGNPMTSNISVGNNQPSFTQNQPSNQPNQNRPSNQVSQPSQSKSSVVSKAFTPSKTTSSYKAPSTYKAPSYTPTNIGVGSNQPQTQQPKQNVVQNVIKTVSNIISNLFRRK